MPSFKRTTVILTLLATTGSDAAQTVVGPHYPIDEPDMLTWIEQRVAAKASSGEIAAHLAAAQQRALRRLEEPEPVEHITRATTGRTAFIDPTYVVPRDVLDHRGSLIARAGTTINPLQHVALSRPLIFLDARDIDQVAFAKRFIDGRDGAARPVLVGGSFLTLMRQWALPVYFDQKGHLVRRLGIRHVPAIVIQDGERLRIDEIVL